MLKTDPECVKNIRASAAVSDPKLNALVQFTKEVVGERGHVSENTKSAFLAAGYAPAAMMEVLVGVALKTISNYLDHLNPTPIDAAFQAEAN